MVSACDKKSKVSYEQLALAMLEFILQVFSADKMAKGVE
jgi:hypothetical protein